MTNTRTAGTTARPAQASPHAARSLFAPCTSLDELGDAAWQPPLQGGSAPLPVWIGERTDLLHGISLAEELYTAVRTPEPCTTGVVLGAPLPAPVRRLVDPLARHWADDPRDLPGDGSVLVVGVYGDLLAAEVQDLIERMYRQRRNLFLLTGRDQHTVSWMIAKQYAAAPDGSPVGVFSAIDTAAAVPGVRWYGAQEMRERDIKGLALDQVWRRVLFHGNGTEDQMHLGQFTLCGLSPAGERSPGLPGPKCAYGLGCNKPEDMLIPARDIRAAELVIANCFSGPLTDHAAYDPKYLSLLNALDGAAQSVVATLFAADAQRPENLAWLQETAAAGSAARALNERLADINPYPAFIQVGLQPPADPHPVPAAATAPDLPLAEISARLIGYLDSGLLGADYPLRDRMRRLSDTLHRDVVRTVLGSAPEGAVVLASLAEEVRSLDLALAQRFARHRDDPAFDFSTYFGERSVVEGPVDLDVSCACGYPLVGFLHQGRVAAVVDTVRGVCPRCGDVLNAYAGAPRLRVDSPLVASSGSSVAVRVEAVAGRPGTVNLGIVPSPTIRAQVRPVLRRVEVAAEETARAEFTVAVEPDAVPQLYSLMPYAVHDLGIAVGRVYFTVVRPDDTSSPHDEVSAR